MNTRIRLFASLLALTLAPACDSATSDSSKTAKKDDTKAKDDGEAAKKDDGEAAKKDDGEAAKKDDGEAAKKDDGEAAKKDDGDAAKKGDDAEAKPEDAKPEDAKPEDTKPEDAKAEAGADAEAGAEAGAEAAAEAGEEAAAEAGEEAAAEAGEDAAAEAGADADAKADEEAEEEAEEEADAKAEEEEVEDLEVDVPAAPASALASFKGPLRFDPVESGDGKLPADNVGARDDASMMDHPIDFGWSKDSKTFAYCQPNGGAECDDCRAYTATLPGAGKGKGKEGKGKGKGKAAKRIKPQKWERGGDCENDQAKEVAAAWKAAKYGKQKVAKKWAFGRDITIVWKYVKGDEAKKTMSEVKIGGRIEGEEPVWILTVKQNSLGKDDPGYDIFPEVIIPSPDGKWIAFMTHAWQGEYSDAIKLKFERTADFAYATYHKTALSLLESNPKRAAELFEHAATIKPKAWKPHHNLACAYSLAKEAAKAKPHLEKALEIGGDKALAKAKDDAHLANARKEEWFATLVK